MLIGAREIESLWSYIVGGGGWRGIISFFFNAEGKKLYFSCGNFYFVLEFQLDFIALRSFHSETFQCEVQGFLSLLWLCVCVCARACVCRP